LQAGARFVWAASQLSRSADDRGCAGRAPRIIVLRSVTEVRAARWFSLPPVVGWGGSGAGTGECHVRDSAGGRCGLDLVGLLEAFQPVPESHAAAEHDR